MSQENSIVLPTGSRKFRETNADSTIFHMADHSAGAPATTTVTRTLPSPRKGNPGTQKVALNFRRTVVLDEDLPTQRSVPIILKIETSIPVGASPWDVAILFEKANNAIKAAEGQALDKDLEDLFVTGMLPNASGQASEEV